MNPVEAFAMFVVVNGIAYAAMWVQEKVDEARDVLAAARQIVERDSTRRAA